MNLQQVSAPPRIKVQPLDTSVSFRNMAYETLKRAITEMDIYDHPDEIRLDERQLSQDLAVSRTPVREAITLLEQEGFVRSVPRRGIFVVRKTKQEILDMIAVWAALESMAARLATTAASDDDLEELKELFQEFERESPGDHISEYSDANIAFHQAVIRLGGCKLIEDMTANLFIHMRAIRKVTIRQENRAERSVVDHRNIINALIARDADLAERLVREHTLGLREHVERHGDFLA
ncbi:GntR family transcriptional regulator [Faunimonas sp. B44]|uniref:GntR family transcriptional regulator n=1 Tax=Faunimonas sp. B44 TaxID=3461493 RepID=UPI004043B72D